MKDEIIQQALFNHDSHTASSFREPLTNLQKELSSFGFGPKLSKVYIYLGKYGPKTAFEIVKALKLRRTEAYSILRTLMNKGVVYSTMQHPMRFAALPLEKAVWSMVNAEKERVRSLEQNCENLVSMWRAIPDFVNKNSAEMDDRFQILQGGNQIRSKVCEIIENSKDVQMLGPEREVMNLHRADAFSSLEKGARNFRLLTSHAKLSSEFCRQFKHAQIRITSNEVHNNLCFVVGENELLFFIRNANDHPLSEVAFWSDSLPMIYSMRMLFDFIWSKSQNHPIAAARI
ncbi:MAG: TrmB family transcriptional regulator [Thaumarchaeota archaeon]|nr:TrmB family transcriptional regulator [Nitrososphaerota archaeon]